MKHEWLTRMRFYSFSE